MTGYPPSLTDEPVFGMRRGLSRWAGINPSAVAAGSEAQATFCIADARHDIAALARELSAEHTARIAAEERVKALTAELADTRAALLHVIRADNGCTPQPPDPAGCTGWDATECGCAIEARDMVAPPAGGEKL